MSRPLTDPDQTKLFYSLKTASHETEISEVTLRRAIADGELRAYKLGGSVRIKPADLEAWAKPVKGGDDE
jgi:excisionase family DNA binding protein